MSSHATVGSDHGEETITFESREKDSSAAAEAKGEMSSTPLFDAKPAADVVREESNEGAD